MTPGTISPKAASRRIGKHSHADVRYGKSKGSDRCDACNHYRGPDDCQLVVAPISPSGWCELFHKKEA